MDVEQNVPDSDDDDTTRKHLRTTSIKGHENQTITADKSQVHYSANNSKRTSNIFIRKVQTLNVKKSLKKRLSDGQSNVESNFQSLLEDSEEFSMETESSQASDNDVVTIQPPAGEFTATSILISI